mmetsp:Transcript_28028/g.42941  ORF Transcript_28028/g.42941 Transcript_28028/m.42941 type:complete len:150 (-) Transcript_28028:361-810(-)
MAQDTDDLFASLGGSLMKDLWSDLEVTENDLDADNMGWSLEQLERELAYMEDQPPLEPPPSASSVPLTTTAAATTTQFDASNAPVRLTGARVSQVASSTTSTATATQYGNVIKQEFCNDAVWPNSTIGSASTTTATVYINNRVKWKLAK